MGRKSNATARRSQIIQALYECLAVTGHESITIKKIAEQAGLAPGVIHYYFKSKDEIISELMSTLQKTYSDLWDNNLKKAVPKDILNTGVDFLIEKMIFDPKLNRVLYNLVQMGFEKDTVRLALKQTYREYRRQITNLFLDAFLIEHRHIKSAAVLAMVEGLALQWMIEPDVMSKKQVKTILLDMINK